MAKVASCELSALDFGFGVTSKGKNVEGNQIDEAAWVRTLRLVIL